MGDIYIFEPANSDEWRRRREEEARRVQTVRERWVAEASRLTLLDPAAVRQIIGVVFDYSDDEGGPCACSCHPKFATLHEGGFDCRCRLTPEERQRRSDAARREREEWQRSPEAEALQRVADEEALEIETWLALEPGVAATRTSMACLEQWEGEIDGRSFYFRERHDTWRIELDLRPNGRFARRFLGVDQDGTSITEPVEMTEGDVIARGDAEDLGRSGADHLAFIVRTVRDYIRRTDCTHEHARRFCPECGQRVE